jgi:beta-lactamase regulating signal transducer with metallopeptidase domain
MTDLVSILGARFVDASVAAILVSGAFALAMVVTRQPSRRRALARAGVVGTLLIVPLVALRPFAPVDLLGPLRLALAPFLDAIDAMVPRRVVAAVRSLPAALLVAYAAGVTLGLARLALGWFGAGWIGRNSYRPSTESEALYQTLPPPTRRPRPALRVSTRTSRPVLLGTFRPTILIPPDLDRLESASALRLALLHELAHAEGADPWFGLAGEVATVVWFWLPTLHWIGRQMRLDQEFLADRRAADRVGTSSKYASTLVEIAASASTQHGSTPTPAGTGSALLQRVLMLVRSPFPVEVRPPRWWLGALGVATALVLLLATGLTLRARTDATPPPSPESRSLTMPQVVLQASAPDAPPTILPIRLPPDFTLEFEVAASDDLTRIEVLGHPLAATPPFPRLTPHRVALRRRNGSLSLTLDGARPTVLDGPSTDLWLTARGLPDRPTIFRSLRLAW